MSDEEFYLLDLKSKFDKIKPNTYYLSYSGGKDSHFLYWFIKNYLHRDDIKIVGINTYMEHQEIMKRILKNSDIVLIPSMKPFEIKEKYGSPCFSKSQDYFIEMIQKGSKAPSVLSRFYGQTKSWHNVSQKARNYVLSGNAHKISPKCCKYLKKEVAKKYEQESGLKPILAVRNSESKMRKSQYKSCFTKDMKFTPIHDLSDELLDKIYTKYNIEIPNVYKYIKRTGCMGCPYGHYKHDTEKELMLLNDKQFDFVCEYFKESYQILGIDIEKIKKERNQMTIFDY